MCVCVCVCGCVLTQCCYRLTDFLRICPLLCAEEQAYSFRSGYIAGGYVVKLDISFTVRLLLRSPTKNTHTQKKKKPCGLKFGFVFYSFSAFLLFAFVNTLVSYIVLDFFGLLICFFFLSLSLLRLSVPFTCFAI